MRLSNRPQKEPVSPAMMQFYCLAAASSIVFLYTILGTYKLIALYYSETFLLVPGLIFFGISLTQELSDAAKRYLKLGACNLIWYVVVKSIHRLQGMEAMSCSMLFCMYLLAFPYAAVTQDAEKQEGLTMAAKMFTVSSLITAGYGLLTVLGHVPAFLESFVKFDGGRLTVLRHPNMTACVYMIGAAFCMGGMFRVAKLWQKGVLLAAAVWQFAMIALTNSRTTLLVGCVLVGGVTFFAIIRGGFFFAVKTPGGWKRILVAAVAAIAVIAGTFQISGELYDANYDRLVRIFIAEQEAAEKAEAETAAEAQADAVILEEAEISKSAEPEVKLQSEYGQGTLSNDMKTLNGRTLIWRAAFQAIKSDPTILLWGTGYADTVLTENIDWFYLKHSHNSWIEVLLKMGIPGLAVALVITWIGLKKSLCMLWKSRDMWKICIALLVPCLMVAGALEPYYFNGYPDYHMIEYIFFLCVGYLSQWKGEEMAETK